MTERWLQIAGWLGLYEVSNLGRVREINGHRICGQWASPKGYMRVRLAKPRRAVDVHRVVALAFVPNPDFKPNINHIDCDTSNNVASNLEWCTQRENLAHAERLGRIKRGYGRGMRSQRAALTDMQAAEARALYAKGGHSFAGLSQRFGISKRSIGRLINGESYNDVQ